MSHVPAVAGSTGTWNGIAHGAAGNGSDRVGTRSTTRKAVTVSVQVSATPAMLHGIADMSPPVDAY